MADRKVSIIAEFGSSPAPEWDFIAWCAAATRVGTDAVKVQLFRAEHFPVNEQASKKPLEFPRKRLADFVAIAHAYGLQAGASVFDAEAVELAARYCDFIKLAGREQVFGQSKDDGLYWQVYRKRGALPVIRSIGNLRYLNYDDRTTTLWVVPKYPASMTESIYQLVKWWLYVKRSRALWNKQWGWSSHTRGIADCVLAARLGASVIEKHLALMPSDVEAGHSLLPDDFKTMCKIIKGEK